MSEIRAADYDDLKYFYGWSKIMEKADIKAIEDAKRKGGKR